MARYTTAPLIGVITCGVSSTSSSPARNCLSNSAFSPTYDEIILFTCWPSSSSPSPNPSTLQSTHTVVYVPLMATAHPALLLTMVSPFTFFSFRAPMRFSGIPHRPNPEHTQPTVTYSKRSLVSLTLVVEYGDLILHALLPSLPFSLTPPLTSH